MGRRAAFGIIFLAVTASGADAEPSPKVMVINSSDAKAFQDAGIDVEVAPGQPRRLKNWPTQAQRNAILKTLPGLAAYTKSKRFDGFAIDQLIARANKNDVKTLVEAYPGLKSSVAKDVIRESRALLR